jgi:nitrate/TMAO reductase-like tetraheme cytochrome c subunit
MSWWRSLRLFLRAHRRGILITLGIVVGLYLLLNTAFMAVSTNEAACTACHNMAPYHRSWERSTHAGVACVRCHQLGFGYFTSALFKYAGGFYNPRAIARVPNEVCLQGDCHELEVVERATGFRQAVAFDHSAHLGELRRGERLWCTSCHSSDIIGSAHFSTHEQTCYICHFKGAEEGRSITPCDTCHTEPLEEVSHAGFTFDHKAYVKLGISCNECHVKIISGDAGVEPERCHDCHPERMDRFNDFSFMHDKHVAERGVSCFRCHSRIEHRSVELLRSLDVRCESCHSELHAPQKQLYMGVGGRGLPDVPSRMFAAKVSCEGCHVGPGPGTAGADAQKTAGYQSKRQACVRCHGEHYDEMLDYWTAAMKSALDYIIPLEERARRLLEGLDEKDQATKEAADNLRFALHNIDLVRRGAGAHNVEYAVRLLGRGQGQIVVAGDQLNQRIAAGRLPEVLRPPDGYCMTLCHSRVARPGDVFYSEMQVDFSHGSHNDLNCTRCHSAQKHKQKVISTQGCMLCHHSEEGQTEYGVDCADCHSAEAAFYRGTQRIEGLRFRPDSMSADVGCVDCHVFTIDEQTGQAGAETLQQILGHCNSCHRELEVEPLPVDDYFLEQELALRRRSDSLTVRAERSRSELSSLERAGKAGGEMRKLFGEIDQGLQLVLRGRPHHNVSAAVLVLGYVEERLSRLERLLDEAR